MQGPAAAALAPAFALISPPSYVSLAIVGAIAVIVYEIRRLVRRLISVAATSARGRRAKRAPLLPVLGARHETGVPSVGRDNAPGLDAAVRIGVAARSAPAIGVHVTAPQESSEREPKAEALPSYLRKEIATPFEPARMSSSSIGLVRDGSVTQIERDSTDESATTMDSAMIRSRPGNARDVRAADRQPLELRMMSTRDRGRLMVFARRLPSHARIALAVDLNNAATLETWVAAAEAADTRTVIAYQNARLVGYASLRRGDAPWTRHVGAICIVVGSTRQDTEIGDCLGREMVAQALDARLKKVTARTIADGATRALYEELGFSAEALLSDQLIDEKGCMYDVLIMSATREQLVDVVPRELRVIAGRQNEPDARDPAEAPRKPPLVALAAGVAHAPSSCIGNANVAIGSSHSEISWHLDDASVAEPSLVAVLTGDAPDTPDTLDAEESTASRVQAASTRGHARPRPIRRAYLIAAMVGAILVAAFVALGIYVINGDTAPKKLEVLSASARPTLPATFAPGQAFESTHAGSGGVFVAVVRPTTTVRVSIDPDVVGTWFWCFESSFGLPLAAHYCAGDRTLEAGRPAELVTQGATRIDPAWPVDAMYFVQMYCEGACVWHVHVVPQ